MKKEAQVVMLPTDTKTKIGIRTNSSTPITKVGELAYLLYDGCEQDNDWDYQHLYIVDDSEIKDGDWCLFFWDGIKDGELGQVGSKPQQYFPKNGHTLNRNVRKIIGTTDPELTFKVDKGFSNLEQREVRVPQLPQGFIESYCENPVEEVMVEYDVDMIMEFSSGTTPSESLKLTSNNELIIHPIEEKLYTREEVERLCRKYGKEVVKRGYPSDEQWKKENL